MIIQDLNSLPQFAEGEVVTCDVETTSWHDDVKGLNPFRGHRVAGYALASQDGKDAWYLPVRHHAEGEELKNLPLANVQAYLKDVFKDHVYSNHNAKFDARFMHFDGVAFPKGFDDTIVLARLVDGNRDKRFGGRGYSLDALSEDFLGQFKDKRVKQYMKALKSEDWGRCPIHLMGEYAMQDARCAARLRTYFLKHLPEPSKQIWEIERRVSRLLLDSEIHGIPINVSRLKDDYISMGERLIGLLSRIRDIAGWEVNVSSNAEMTDFLSAQLGIEPQAFTEEGEPSWSATVLETLDIPAGYPDDLGHTLSEASRLSHIISNFCEGWLATIGDDNRLHSDFRQWGTITGRLSSSGPNVQNFDDIVESWIEDPEGRVLLYYDLSQAEYRVFGHYTNASAIMSAYQANVDTDFHMWLADKMGVSRQFAKTMNFSFIYGMGKKKLLKALSALLALAARKGDDRLNARLRSISKGSKGAAEGAELFSSAETAAAAEIIYNEYHQFLPEIRQFQKRINNLCRVRGWFKNFYGRVYRIPTERSYVGVNYVVQGTVGDYMKDRSATLFEQTRDLDAHMINEIHDAAVWLVPRANALEFHRRAMPAFESSPFRLPMRADSKVSGGAWGQMEKLDREGATLDAAIEASKRKPFMTWDEREKGKFAGTSKKGRGGAPS